MITLSCDFETNNYEDDCRVWLWGAVNIDTLEFIYDKDMESFIKYIESYNSNIRCYFHNLKFDGGFILDYLLRNSYEYSTDNCIYTFETLIDEMGNYYSIKIRFENSTVSIYDSAKRISGSVRDIAKAYHLPIAKGEIDYEKYREVGYMPDNNEVEYLRLDCEIIARVLKIQFDEGLKKMTTASNALECYKKEFCPNYNLLYPLLNEPLDTKYNHSTIDQFCRYSYKGGLSILNPKYVDKKIGMGRVYDVNSMYPHAMRNKLLPYGMPIYFEGGYIEDEEYPLYIIHIQADFSIKEGYVPFIQLKHKFSFSEQDFIEQTDRIVDLYLTSAEHEMFLESYEMNEYYEIEGYKFKGSYNLFTDYVDYWYEVKCTSTGAKKELAKLMLNSLYGKFGTRITRKKKIPYFDEEHNKVKYITTEPEDCTPIYMPVASFITSYARMELMSAILKLGGYKEDSLFVYCDTDSVHCLNDDKFDYSVLGLDNKELGKFKHEYNFLSARYICSKRYFDKSIIKINVNKRKPYNKETRSKLINKKYYVIKNIIRASGLPENSRAKIKFDEFILGAIFERLRLKTVPGGRVLERSEYEFKL